MTSPSPSGKFPLHSWRDCSRVFISKILSNSNSKAKSIEVVVLAAAARFVETVDASKKLNTIREPSVIISASGMMTGGRVLHHLKFLVPDYLETIELI